MVATTTGALLAFIALEIALTGIARSDPVLGGFATLLLLVAAGIAHTGNKPGAWQ